MDTKFSRPQRADDDVAETDYSIQYGGTVSLGVDELSDETLAALWGTPSPRNDELAYGDGQAPLCWYRILR